MIAPPKKMRFLVPTILWLLGSSPSWPLPAAGRFRRRETAASAAYAHDYDDFRFAPSRDKRKARAPLYGLHSSCRIPSKTSLLASYLVRPVAVLERHFLQRHTSKVRRATFGASHAGSLRRCFRPSFSTAMQRL